MPRPAQPPDITERQSREGNRAPLPNKKPVPFGSGLFVSPRRCEERSDEAIHGSRRYACDDNKPISAETN